MIEWHRFKAAMGAISQRCARPPGDQQLLMYYEFLSPRLTTEEFMEAALAVWSSAEFFPPPVKFLEARTGREWDKVAPLVESFNPPHLPVQWVDRWMALPEETRATVRRLGGPAAFKAALYDRDVPRAMRTFTEVYTAVLRDSAAVLTIPDDKFLPAGEVNDGGQ